MQRKPLGFRSSVLNPEECVSVGDDRTGYLDGIVKLGCFTPDEVIAWEQWIDRVRRGALKEKAWIEAQFAACAMMLRLRQDPEVTEESLKEAMQGRDAHLINLLYEFYVAERSRHAPSVQLFRVEGEGAKEAAVEVAKQRNGVAVFRVDFPGTYVVLKALSDITEGFEVVADYTTPIEVKPVAVGKSKTKTA